MRKLQTFSILSFLFILNACAGSGDVWQSTTSTRPAQEAPSEIALENIDRASLEENQDGSLTPVKVAILLPLSGQHQKLGNAMLNAAQIALFDLGYDNFTLIPKDTLGTPDGAATATRTALRDGAELVIGPIFSGSVRAAQRLTNSANVPMIAFSTDWTLANRRTFLIGFLPFDQVERVTSYAVSQGLSRHGVLSPSNTYGDGVISAYRTVAPKLGVQNSRIERFDPKGKDLAVKMEIFSDYNARKASNNAYGAPFDAVLLPVGGAQARQVGSFLNHYDLPPRDVRRLGTGLMDDSSLANDSTLSGTWFAAPSMHLRSKFERRYRNVYGNTPPRIASLAYDATALATILAQMGLKDRGRPAYSYSDFTNPNGFSGVDGIFRFRPDGISERGLAVLEFQKGRIVEIDPAPKSFKRNSF